MPQRQLADALHFVEGQADRARLEYRNAVTLAKKQLKVNDRDWRTLGQLAVYQAQLGNTEGSSASLQRACSFPNATPRRSITRRSSERSKAITRKPWKY